MDERQSDDSKTKPDTPAAERSASPVTPAAADQSTGDAVSADNGQDAPKSVSDGGTAVEGSALSEEELDRLTSDIVAAMKTVYDPEIPADIYELGLIYRIEIDDNRFVTVDMTLTSPGCPVAGEMPGWVENAVGAVEGVSGSKINLTFDPPWDQSRMSDEARLALNMF
jgi:FeS assembly SUF system protein